MNGFFNSKTYKPRILWMGIRNAAKVYTHRKPLEIARHLAPPGNPGAGIFHGRHNISKALTYRATYVPGGFNVARDARRALRAARAASLI